MQTDWTQIWHDKTPDLIWIQSFLNSDGISETFKKHDFEKKKKKKQQTTKICKNYPGGKELRKEKSVSHFKTVHEL